MRASRLLSILTTLQARGLVTATALANECGVSLRTIYRDIDALSASGIPVYSERGADGGYRLLDGYRTQLNGLSSKEAEVLFLTGLSGPAADLGLGAITATAQTKLLSAMPEPLRLSAEQMRARFHLDAPAWFAQAEQPALLPLAADAVWTQRLIHMRYQSWKAETTRTIAPLGLVLKSGAWYLVGQIDDSFRTYRISRILELTVLDERFERPAEFDLASYWQASTRRLEAELHQAVATIRFSARGIKMLDVFLSPYVAAATQIEPEADSEGRRIATVPIGSIRYACVDLMRFGTDAEVLEPPELRASMAEIAQGMASLYTQSIAEQKNL